MTTIACTLHTMAADTQATEDSGIMSQCTKLHEKHGCAIGFAGDLEDGLKFVAAFPDFDELDLGDDFEALVLTPVGIDHYTSGLIPMKIEQEYYAIGSGAGPALGVLHLMGDPILAVETAMQIDAFTGGKVRHITITRGEHENTRTAIYTRMP